MKSIPVSKVVLLGAAFLCAACGANVNAFEESNDSGNVDADGDGWTLAEGDCNDRNPNIHPKAKEACDDDFDNDCDEEINEDCDSGEI
jgi:hypothetical protein